MTTSRRAGPIALLMLLLALVLGAALWMVLREPATSADDMPATPPPQAERVERPRPSTPAPREHVETPTTPAPPPSAPESADADESDSTRDGPHVGAPRVRTVRVTILREDGGPAGGAHVRAFSNFGYVFAIPDDARTDRDGTVTVQVPGRANFRLRAWTDDSAAISDRLATEPGGEESVTLRLAPAVAVHGRVESDGGGAIVGARVALRLAQEDAFPLAVTTESGADGVFELGSVPRSRLDAGPAALEASADGHAPLAQPFDPDRSVGGVVLVLQRGLTVRGRFVGPGNAPVAGVGVFVNGRPPVASADDGTFELDSLPRTGVRLRIDPPDHVTPPFRDLPAGQDEIDLGDIVLDPGLPVRGTVTDGAGTPIPGAEVRAAHPTLGFVKHTTTGDDGTFTLPAIGPDEHTVVVQAPADGTDWSARRTASATGVTGGTAGLRLELTGALSVVVTFRMESDRSEVRVASAEVRTVRTDAETPEMQSSWSGPGMTSVRVQLENAGTYDVVVNVPGYDEATVRGVQVMPDREVLIDALFRVTPE